MRRWVERRRWRFAPKRFAALVPEHITEDKFLGWLAEAESLLAKIRAEFEKATWSAGQIKGDTVEYDRGPILYALVRALGAENVVETGVASGSSSRFILEAMRKNGHGHLYSVDLPDGTGIAQGRSVGWLVPEELRSSWTLRLGDAKKELPKLLQEVPSLDLFFHDSDHSEEHMTFEFTQAWGRLRIGMVLGSDDVYWNHAWENFVKAHARPVVLVGGMGFTTKVSTRETGR